MQNITASMVKELREITGAAMMDCKKALTECQGDAEAAKELLRKKGQTIASKKSSRDTKEGGISIKMVGDSASLIKIACETDFVARNENFRQFLDDLAEQAIETGYDNFMETKSRKGAIKDQFIATIAKLGENTVFLEGQVWKASDKAQIGAYVHSNYKIGVMVELVADKDIDKEKSQVLAKDIAMHIAASKVEAIREEDVDPAVLEKERNFLIEQAKESGKPENIIGKMVDGRMNKYKKEICLLYQPFDSRPYCLYLT